MRLGVPFTGLASLLVGLLQTMWATIPLFPNSHNSLFFKAVHAAGAGEEWLAVMFASGAFLSFASLNLNRGMRHMALIISSMVMLSTFGLFTSARTITPVTLTTALLGVYALFLLWFDVKCKESRKGGGR